ncbi:MAG: GDP-mannose 4,6-dehydratase [Chlorobium sp.]
MKALVCGIGGQDGAYLAQHLLNKGYEVIGSSRDAMATSFVNLDCLGIKDRIIRISMAINDFRSILGAIIRFKPDEIYNLAGQSSVGLSFEQPVETMDSIVGGTLNLLEAIRFSQREIRFYNAGSTECFGDTGEHAANEESAFSPRSPYAVAKSAAYWLVRNYRESYGLFACTGILSNHESPLRPERFVTQKIISAARRISAGSDEMLRLGNIDIVRDWGWAPDYVEAMHRMLNIEKPDDFVIATGRSVSLEYFISRVFSNFGLSFEDHVVIDRSLLRPSDIKTGHISPAKANKILLWRHSIDVDLVIDRMCSV